MKSCTETEGWLRGKQNQLETINKKKLEKINLYELNPSLCKQCSKALSYKENQKGKVFCNQSCSASYNNKGRQRSVKKNCPTCNQEFKKRRSNRFCSLKCFSNSKKINFLEKNVQKFLKGELTDKNRPTIKKVLNFLGVENKCSCCGLDEWMGKPLSLILDHIDGKANNNTKDNLRLICHNCDSQTDHYKGKNKGNGRKSLGLV